MQNMFRRIVLLSGISLAVGSGGLLSSCGLGISRADDLGNSDAQVNQGQDLSGVIPDLRTPEADQGSPVDMGGKILDLLESPFDLRIANPPQPTPQVVSPQGTSSQSPSKRDSGTKETPKKK